MSPRPTPAALPATRRVVAELEMPPRRVVVAVLAGAAALGSALALLMCAGWLIARASQRPFVQELSLVVVAVRALGIGRGVFRYLERLASHDVALTGLVRLRERCYVALVRSPASKVLGYRRGDLLDRLGADIDAVGDVVVKGVLPFASSAVVGLAAVIAATVVFPLAGVSLTIAFVVSGVVVPWLTARAAATAHRDSAQAATDIATRTQALVDGLAELEVLGATQAQHRALAAAEKARFHARDVAARPAGLAAGLNLLAVGFAVLVPLLAGSRAVEAGTLGETWLVVVTLMPLAALEATTVLPSAAVELVKGERSAQRVAALLDGAVVERATDTTPMPARPHRLEARELTTGWDSPVLTDVDLTLDLTDPTSLALVGPSGAGKTSLLVTLAGLVPPLRGTLTLIDDASAHHPLASLDPAGVRRLISFSAEDAHVFGTSVRENLRLAAGDVEDARLLEALDQVGLRGWVEALPEGLGTPLASGGTDISGGQRRRLLVARALLTGARVLLLDEPTEHLDTLTGDALLADLARLGQRSGVSVVVATHRREAAAAFDVVFDVTQLNPGHSTLREVHR